MKSILIGFVSGHIMVLLSAGVFMLAFFGNPAPEILSAQAEKSSDDLLAGLEEKQMWKHLGEGVYEFPWRSPGTTWVSGDVIWPGTLVRFIREHPDLEVTAISETTFGSVKRPTVVTKKK